MRLLKRFVPTLCVAILCTSAQLFADTVILHDGSSYSGSLVMGSASQLTFTGDQGVQYTFPRRDVQSIVFTPTNDVVTLHTGKSYSGHYTGGQAIRFVDSEGVRYEFPVKDISSVVFSAESPASEPHKLPADAKVISPGAELSIRIDEGINSKHSTPGQLYSATVSGAVYDSAGVLAIPQGSPAKVIVRNVSGKSSELVLDLYSVTVNGRNYRVITSDIDETNHRGVGANRRTAEYGGAGAGFGALVGAVFGGGSGAGIGAASGAAGGLLTQFFTRGKEVKVPAETVLTFRLDRRLVLRPGQNVTS